MVEGTLTDNATLPPRGHASPDPACISLPTSPERAMLPAQPPWPGMLGNRTKPGLQIGYQMFWQSIRRKIVSIALGLIILMVLTSILSIIMANRVDYLLNVLTTKYIAAYSHLARTNIRSLERGLALRQMVIAKMENPPDEAGYAARSKIFEQKGLEVEKEAAEARKLIAEIVADVHTSLDNITLLRIDSRIDMTINDFHRYLRDETEQLIAQLQKGDFTEIRRTLIRVDRLRDEFNQKIDNVRADMLSQVYASATTVMRDQRQAILISAIVTTLAAIVGLVFAILVSLGITRPVLQLLAGTREVEAGRLDRSIDVTARDEIGQLSAAFNRMIEQLRQKEKIRETFGRYLDPKIVEDLINRPALASTEGQRQIMTVMFCDVKGFTSLSEGMTPQGLVKVMNRYLSTMSEPIHIHQGIIDKYIGDAIMAYWGPPFVDEEAEARLACLAGLDMTSRVARLRKDLPELLGVRAIPVEFDLRIGVATGEALVGSIGSEFMMSYTVMGDTVNLASRLEGANREYGSRSLISERTAAAAGAEIEVREIDRLVVVGQTQSTAVFEIMGRQGELVPKQLLLRTRYSEGLAAYRARQWDEARRAFNAALEAVRDDGPSRTLASRIDILQANPPPTDWDGSWRLDQK
jgi:class 3 adenylate cyclase